MSVRNYFDKEVILKLLGDAFIYHKEIYDKEYEEYREQKTLLGPDIKKTKDLLYRLRDNLEDRVSEAANSDNFLIEEERDSLKGKYYEDMSKRSWWKNFIDPIPFPKLPSQKIIDNCSYLRELVEGVVQEEYDKLGIKYYKIYVELDSLYSYKYSKVNIDTVNVNSRSFYHKSYLNHGYVPSEYITLNPVCSIHELSNPSEDNTYNIGVAIDSIHSQSDKVYVDDDILGLINSASIVKGDSTCA